MHRDGDGEPEVVRESKVSRASARRSIGPLITARVIAIVACGDPYRHTNPYDPAVPVAIAVSGPDTLFSSFQLATFSVQVAPAFPDTAIQWSSSGLEPAREPRDRTGDCDIHVARHDNRERDTRWHSGRERHRAQEWDDVARGAARFVARLAAARRAIEDYRRAGPRRVPRAPLTAAAM